MLQWSEQDFLGGLEENMRIVQECEAKFARMMASHPEVGLLHRKGFFAEPDNCSLQTAAALNALPTLALPYFGQHWRSCSC